MVNSIDFTDRGMFFIIRRDRTDFDLDYLRIAKFASTDNLDKVELSKLSTDIQKKEFIEERFGEIFGDEIAISLPVDNINPLYNPNEKLYDIKKIPYFAVSKDIVPNYGYLVLTKTQLYTEERFNKILRSHRSILNSKTKLDLVCEMKKAVNEINEYNHKKVYALIGYDYRGKKICDTRQGLLKNQIFDNYKRIETRKLFIKCIHKEIDDSCYYGLLDKDIENSLENNSLMEAINKFCKYEDFGEFIEVDFDGNKEIYAKSNLLEDLMSDYDKKYAKETIRKVILEWSNQLAN